MSTPAVMATMDASTTQPAKRSFADVEPLIWAQLQRRIAAGVLSTAAVLDEFFVQVFGADRPARDRLRFLLFAAPIARRIAIQRADPEARIAATDVTVADVKLWLWWLDSMDPLCARMIDLHYFAGLTVKKTAAALELSPGAVIRDLRFARSWLTIKLPAA